MIELKGIKLNPDNPRTITDDEFQTTLKSVKEFGEVMLPLRPILIDNGIVICGNQRFKALKELGYTKVPVEWIKDVTGLSKDDKRQLIIKDNLQYGNWSFENISESYDIDDLVEWGMPKYMLGSRAYISDLLEEDDEDDVVIEAPKNNPEEAKISDTGFAKFEIVIKEEDKRFILDVIYDLKTQKGITSGDAFVEIFKAYKG